MSHRSRRASRIITAAAALATAVAGAASIAPVEAASSGPDATYLVLYKSGASTADASRAVDAAGGRVVATYPQIGVVVARSGEGDFATTIRRTSGVQGAAATAAFATSLGQEQQVADDAPAAAPAPAAWGDSLSGLQWDMRSMDVPQAHQVTGGDRGVLVADLDTGLDFTHPDLAPNYDAEASTDCTSGTPAPLLTGNDKNGHGTHTAGTIAAAANGAGIVGVAPDVRIAGVKTGNDAGFFLPEAVVCSFMWAATHGVDVTNNSYFADPWYMNCKTDPDQRAIWEAERRAISYAQSQGTVVVAAEGNFADDLSHPDQDTQSPDNTTPTTRDVTNACAVVPVEVPGVIGVTATGVNHLKSYYSSYGISTADVAAPGGDARYQLTPEAPNGRVLSTWPSDRPCSRAQVEGAAHYCYLQGTSMASPHAAGLAALILSAHPRLDAHGVEALMESSATPLPCPDTSQPMYAGTPSANGGNPQVCTGGTGHNSFYGAGEVNALRAVQ